MIVWLSHVAGSARHCESDPHSGVPQWQRLTFSHVMSCHGLLERGHPSIVFATQFAAQLVFYKLGEVARYRQLAWFHGAAGHAHWQGARGYWFERHIKFWEVAVNIPSDWLVSCTSFHVMTVLWLGCSQACQQEGRCLCCYNAIC